MVEEGRSALRSDRLRYLSLTIASLACGLVLWQVISVLVPAYLVPSPISVVLRWGQLAQSGVLGADVLTTLEEALLGFLLGSATALVLGYLVARVRLLEAIASPYVAASQAMPMLAFAPLLITLLGIGLLPNVLIAALIIFFPTLVNTVVAVRGVDPEVLDAARTDGAGAGNLLLHVEAPLSLPVVLSGVKISVTLAMTGAIVAEFVASSSGLGYLLQLGRTDYDGPMVFAAALTVAAVSVLAYAGTTALEHALRRRL
ncbi:MAG: ABC transporter permease [Candidatus Dormibacteraceae bacterium]